MPAHQLVVADATLRGRAGRWHVGIDDGRVAALTQDTLTGRDELDAAGGLVTESFVDAHLHLDKVHTLDRAGDAALTAYTSGQMGSALHSIELASAVKADYDRSWIEPNARAALMQAVRFGVRHVLAFADVDTSAGLEGVIPLLALREELRGVVDLKVVAFPQDGLLCDPGAEELVGEAVDLGADVVGGIPWVEHTDAEAREHVRRMCELAAAHDRGVAMLVDDAGDPTLHTTQMLAEAMLAHGLVGRGVAHHARAVGLYPRPSLERLAGLARRAGLGFVSDPHTGPLHLPVRELTAMGLPVALGQDDIEDAFYPFGRHNMTEVAFLGAHALGAVDTAGIDLVYDAVTTTAATVLGLTGHRLEVGGNADLVVHRHERLRPVLAHHEAPAYVVASGRLVAASSAETTFSLPGPG
ncbi:MAG TPA: amidohydrolase family protein [Nocardioides sp.]|uniref:amidohydrolase family protein n=1 Tax=Nocardioides sp. TaxID=35761 RepID=UPI002E350E8D|nr:amidohydrolase family protein [Nocardioides sp.]HEX3930141.1 amidohydrolase family protein [Nocardioides sp.]